ncbi:MAG: hypothetical protein RML38_02890 [Bacteroidia bacterium]|nr:hypothetical protein [Bacteroidia bacterium]
MGVSLRCARVGVLRATLRFGAAHCSCTLRMPHANCILMFYLTFILAFVLPHLAFIFNDLQG